MISIKLPYWYDLHAHFRQDALLPATIKDHVAMACAGVLGMPNTKPPLTTLPQIAAYREQLLSAGEGALLEAIVPLYLSAETTPAMIESGARDGILKACKYYPPHGTTGAEHGAALQTYIENGVFAAMEAAGIVLCVHGEEHGLPPEAYFDRAQNAEEIFYTQRLPRVVDVFPKLKIVGEHLTTKIGVDFILSAPAHVKASVTPQHLLYTVGHLLQGFKYHLYCLPLVKFDADRAALRAAVTAANNTKFFAGTDSAPHAQKLTPCGCAAGCYTGGIAPQLYAQAFEEAGIDMQSAEGVAAFEAFLCTIGRDFYGLPVPQHYFTLRKQPQKAEILRVNGQDIVPLPLGMGGDGVMNWSLITHSD
jgi:dihydroorotase